MTRRNLVILIVLLVAGIVLWQRYLSKPSKDESASQTKAQATETVSAQDEPQSNEPSSAKESSRSVSTTPEMQPRAVREPRVPAQKTKANTSAAQLERSSLFADTSWKIWTGMSAVPKAKGAGNKKIQGEVNGFYLIEDSLQAASFAQFSSAQPLVVIDTRLDLVGVVTGVFAVVLKNGVSAEIFAQMPEIKVVNSFPNIQTYYVTSANEPFDLSALKEFLRTEPGVADVQIEILSRQYEKY